jgi:hypothetical protein
LNIKQRKIGEFLLFTAITLVIVSILSLHPNLQMEAIVVSVVIFAIYLIVSGRITELKFQDLDIKINNAKEKPITISKLSEPFAHSISDIEHTISNYITTDDNAEKVVNFEKYIIPKWYANQKIFEF